MVQLGGTRLRHELDRVPLWRGDHVGIKQLVEDMARYLYLPRLRDEDVLLAAIHDGIERLTWQTETFAYAEGWDESRKRYQGLQAGQTTRVLIDAQSLLVKPEVAQAQMAAAQEAATPTGEGEGPGPNLPPPPGGAPGIKPGKEQVPREFRRFHGSVKMNPIRLGRDASRIGEEIVQHLAGIVGANVEITLEIRCELPEAATDKLVRDVTENCHTLGFSSYGFEEA